MNREETMQLLAALKTLDPQGWVTIDNTTIDVWVAAMNREPAIPAGAAMATALEITSRGGEKFPAPGDFRGMVAEVICGIPTADEARRQIERSMRLNYPGMPARYTPDRIVLDAVRQIGGVHVFRVSQSERETEALWRQFRTAYGDLRAERLDALDIGAAWTERQQLAGGDRAAIGAGVNGEGQ